MTKINIKKCENNELFVQIDEKKITLYEEEIELEYKKNEKVTHFTMNIKDQEYYYENEFGKLNGNLNADQLDFTANEEISLFNLENHGDQTIWTDLIEKNGELTIKLYNDIE